MKVYEVNSFLDLDEEILQEKASRIHKGRMKPDEQS
jgi:hypothetical protein